jgi:hypothetical protein
MQILVIKDMKSQLFLRPTLAASLADGLRGMEVMVNDGDSMIRRFPNDFRLYHVGSFDPNTGKLDVLPDYQDLGSCSDFVRSSPTPMFPSEQAAN